MGKLLLAQIYRSLHDKVLWLLIILTFLICIVFWNGMSIRSIRDLENQIDQIGLRQTASAYAWDGYSGSSDAEKDRFFDYYVSYSSARILREINPILFFSLYAAAYFVGSKFTQRTIQYTLYNGYSRGKVMIAAFLGYAFLIVLTLLFCLTLYLFGKFGLKSLKLFASPGFWRNIALWLYLILSYMAFSFSAAFIIRNIFGTLFASFGLMLVSAVIPTSTFRGDVLHGRLGDFLPLGILEKESLWMQSSVLDTSQTAMLFALPILLIALSLCIAYFGYRNQMIV